MTTIQYWARHVIPAAYALLPVAMASPQASAMILATCLQESKFKQRRQRDNGPARGFPQFEINGVLGLCGHPKTVPALRAVCKVLCYPFEISTIDDTRITVRGLHLAMTDNDVLACVLDRLNLWWLEPPLPERDNPAEGYAQYLEAWNPNRKKTRPTEWPANFERAWGIVNAPSDG